MISYNHKMITQIKKDEGFRATFYFCTAGKKTIGYGHAYEINPITTGAVDIVLSQCKAPPEIKKRLRNQKKRSNDYTKAQRVELLDHTKLSKAAANYIFELDVHTSWFELKKSCPWVEDLSDNLQGVLINMCFNLGITKLLKFKKTLKAFESGDYEKAALEMMQSKWATQVGPRATRLQKVVFNEVLSKN